MVFPSRSLRMLFRGLVGYSVTFPLSCDAISEGIGGLLAEVVMVVCLYVYVRAQRPVMDQLTREDGSGESLLGGNQTLCDFWGEGSEFAISPDFLFESLLLVLVLVWFRTSRCLLVVGFDCSVRSIRNQAWKFKWTPKAKFSQFSAEINQLPKLNQIKNQKKPTPISKLPKSPIWIVLAPPLF